MTRRPKKPSKSTKLATLDLVRPLAFPTREAWERYLEERRELRAKGLTEGEVEQITGELETPCGD